MKYLKYLLFALLLVGCAHSIPVDNCLTSHLYGFWGGFWHGFIFPFSFIGSLFDDNIVVYAINNTGGWYDFGFVLGVNGGGIISYISK